MVAKLPKWIELGAFALATVAGFINAVGLLGFEHQAVSHVSGTASTLGVSLLDGPWQTSIMLVAIIVAFAFGASLAGLLLQGGSLKLGRHYDTALFIEAILLAIALLLLHLGSASGILFASAACGLQNALATTYSGAIIRTTHLTGIVTDLGLMLGGLLRRQPFDKRKATLFGLIIAGFICGGIAAALLFERYAFFALLLPIFACLIMALAYRYIRKQTLSKF